MPFTAIVVDDEPLARDELKYLLSFHPECQIIGEADNAEEALKLVVELRPDVVFLDIRMRGTSGFEAAKRMLSLPHPPLVVFATAYDDYAVGAFELGAVDYILKPFEPERLAQTVRRLSSFKSQSARWEEALERLSQLLEEGPPKLKKLPVEKEGEIRLIPYQDIIFAQAHEGEALVHTANEYFYYRGTLAELEGRLKNHGFLRVHKSFLVNLARIGGLVPWFKGTYWVIMEDDKRTHIPVSKAQVKQLKALLGLPCSPECCLAKE
ncbi:two component transcriptional regulator, LytTR family [Ammonifex degensii KC4]|uniref:Stage 0 sporulation protein A homolog n=1 Tax=Ammonifex degensii (strain DSM 10501 / KC4) TaxID=429009 RepID=C9RCQ8_AMMDK|nr:LytTR family DNA-binding domain-containing protein [Ammonifex degensii]ACX52035.1 two component transcriptional regulator, LytTR family [Ammonifex degensii KC4]